MSAPTMELQHTLSADVTTPDPSYTGTPLEACSSQRAILQERFANWPQEYNTIPINSASPNSTSPKSSRGHCPTESVLPSRFNAVGSYSTDNAFSNHAILAGFGVERSEQQVEHDLKRLYQLLARSDKYQKYREKQPVLTPEELVTKETIEKARGKEDKEKVVWPEFLEKAFWEALVKWPPMGRKKYMLNGILRGRNELVQDFIEKSTGVKRNRKQVSSHIQVLKQILRDQPGVLIYMASMGSEKRRHQGNKSPSIYHSAHCTVQSQRGVLASEYSATTWPYDGESLNQDPFSITQFVMLIEEEERRVHTITQLSSNSRLENMSVADSVTWSRQYPEFAFLGPQMQEWAMQEKKILVCDASLKMMSENMPCTHLSIAFDLCSQYDLSGFETLQCTTRFYDNSDVMFDDGLKEQNAHCEFVSSTGRLRLPFGSAFWVDRISQYQAMTKGEVDCSLMRLTATQDVYGFQQDSGKVECLVTIFWRFRQTQNSVEAGHVRWQAVTLSDESTTEKEWGGKEPQAIANHAELVPLSPSSIDASLYQHIQSSGLPLDLNAAHHTYAVHHPQPPQLSLNTVASMSVPDFDPNASAAPSTATDYSHYSHYSLAPSTTTDHSFTYEAFDLTGGHMAMSGAEAFGPVNNMAVYDNFAGQYGFVEQEGFSGLGMACNVGSAELAHVGVPDTPDSACYPTNATGQHLDFLPQTYGQVGRRGGMYYELGSDIDMGLWGMQSPFYDVRDDCGGLEGTGI